MAGLEREQDSVVGEHGVILVGDGLDQCLQEGRKRGEGRVLRPSGGAARRLGAADAARRACAEGRLKRRFAYLRGDGEGPAGRPGAGDNPHHGVCLGEDE